MPDTKPPKRPRIKHDPVLRCRRTVNGPTPDRPDSKGQPPRHIPLTGLTTHLGQRRPPPTDAPAYRLPTTRGGLHQRPHSSLTPQGHKSGTFKRYVPTPLHHPKTTKTANLLRKHDSRSSPTPRRGPRKSQPASLISFRSDILWCKHHPIPHGPQCAAPCMIPLFKS
jgi:hypothetical protein